MRCAVSQDHIHYFSDKAGSQRSQWKQMGIGDEVSRGVRTQAHADIVCYMMGGSVILQELLEKWKNKFLKKQINFVAIVYS